MNLFARKECRHSCREWTRGHSGGGREWDEWRSSIRTHTLSCVKWIAGEKLLYHKGSPIWCSVMAKSGRMGGRGQRLKREVIYV